jgi:23S rRNA-/tRNA-specific pseudouridylate synthase
VLARSAEAHRDLNAQFRIREIKKIYHALAQGVPDWSKKTVDLPLRVDGDRKHRTVVNYEKGKIAITELEVVQLFIGYSLISAQPRSGYTHQIRAHLAAFGLPILQDTLYAPPGISQPATLPIKRLALHALSITFIHPISRQLISFDAPYPADFSCLLAELKSRAD